MEKKSHLSHTIEGVIVEDINEYAENEEEIELLEENNPELLEAYRSLVMIAIGKEEK